MKKFALTVASAVTLSLSLVAPAHAVVVEDVQGYCRVNLTYEEQSVLGYVDAPLFLTPEHHQQFTEWVDEDIQRIENPEPPIPGVIVVESNPLDNEDLSKLKSIQSALKECFKAVEAPKEQPGSKSQMSSNLGLSALSGFLGAIFGALATIAALFPHIHNLLPRF